MITRPNATPNPTPTGLNFLGGSSLGIVVELIMERFWLYLLVKTTSILLTGGAADTVVLAAGNSLKTKHRKLIVNDLCFVRVNRS